MAVVVYRIQCLMLTLLLLLVTKACRPLENQAPIAPATSRPPELPEELILNEEKRRQTVIFDIASGRIEHSEQWNPLTQDARLDKGFHQAMIEPLFILNYECGMIEPWLGEQMTANSDQDVWTLTLREGITWSDGAAFTANDVVFSVNLLLEHPDLELDFFFHIRWVRPIGEPVSNYNNQVRWSNEEYSAIVDEMASLPLGDPRVDALFVEAMVIWFDELPFIPLVQDKQLISFDTTYWQNWPTADNAYVHPPLWWQSAHIIIHHLEPANQ